MITWRISQVDNVSDERGQNLFFCIYNNAHTTETHIYNIHKKQDASGQPQYHNNKRQHWQLI